MDVGSGLVTVASGLNPTNLVTAIKAGRGDGSWTGTSGITSSVAATDVSLSIPRAVGWLDNGDGSMTAAFAAPGDTNLDWQVDVLDASNFLSFGKYDTGNYNTPVGASGIAAVPEPAIPAGLLLASAAAVALLRRRQA